MFPPTLEGFPQALLQGMGCGLPRIGFEQCPTANELIVDRVTGLLPRGIDDQDALAEKMEALMSSPDLREQHAKEGPAIARSYTDERFLNGRIGLVDDLHQDRLKGTPTVAKSLSLVEQAP